MESDKTASGCSVSVVIPCWRCADVIGRAVASVAAQTLPPREIILVDDASGDGTLSVLHALAKRCPDGKIKVLSLSCNSGPGIARNAGWDVAQGDYVAFLDADDAWHSRKLEIQMDWMSRHPDVDFCGHRSHLLEEGETEPPVAATVDARALSLLRILYANPVQTRTVVVKQPIAVRFEDRSVSEDFLLWIELLATGRKCFILSLPLAICFRPEFSAGGYSGNLWQYERRELRAFVVARRKSLISFGMLAVVCVWSLVKYVRRVAIRAWRALGAKA